MYFVSCFLVNENASQSIDALNTNLQAVPVKVAITLCSVYLLAII